LGTRTYHDSPVAALSGLALTPAFWPLPATQAGTVDVQGTFVNARQGEGSVPDHTFDASITAMPCLGVEQFRGGHDRNPSQSVKGRACGPPVRWESDSTPRASTPIVQEHDLGLPAHPTAGPRARALWGGTRACAPDAPRLEVGMTDLPSEPSRVPSRSALEVHDGSGSLSVHHATAPDALSNLVHQTAATRPTSAIRLLPAAMTSLAD